LRKKRRKEKNKLRYRDKKKMFDEYYKRHDHTMMKEREMEKKKISEEKEIKEVLREKKKIKEEKLREKKIKRSGEKKKTKRS